MRPRVPWMTETDDTILEYFEALEAAGFSVWQAPTPIWVNLTDNLGATEKSRETISRRMGKLEQMGLLERVDETRGYYRITEKGLAYLSGELEREELVESNPEN